MPGNKREGTLKGHGPTHVSVRGSRGLKFYLTSYIEFCIIRHTFQPFFYYHKSSNVRVCVPKNCQKRGIDT